MSDAVSRSHIPDERLVELTEEKIAALEIERAELEHQLVNEPTDVRAQRALANKEEATDKLTERREEMLDATHPGDH